VSGFLFAPENIVFVSAFALMLVIHGAAPPISPGVAP